MRLGLEGAAAVRRAAEAMAAALAGGGRSPEGFLVQRMAAPGVEMIVGVVHDRQFGPVVACGAGGVQVELIRDVAVRLTPLAREDAGEMLRSLRTFPLLAGFRGRPPADVAALEDAVLRVGAMVEDLPEIAEMDLNPIVVHASGVSVVDARIRVAPSVPPPPLGARR